MNGRDCACSNINHGSSSGVWISLGTEGEQGSEDGRTVADEELADTCRITLEEGCPIGPYGITCGIYGLLVHTTWASTLTEAMHKYESMKRELADFAEAHIDKDFLDEAWCSDFVKRWS